LGGGIYKAQNRCYIEVRLIKRGEENISDTEKTCAKDEETRQCN